jgi:chorismate dehydratase
MTVPAGRPVTLGAVGYLNAKPLVFGLERSPRFAVRLDLPSRCATLLHEGAIDVGLIPSIEYLRGPAGDGHRYRIVPGLAIASQGPVASVALYTKRPIADVRSIAVDTSSRTSVALVRVLCARLFKIEPSIETRGPDLEKMLAASDAALIIGDNALLLDHASVRIESDQAGLGTVEKIDLGEAWTALTGLPFVYAFWAGRPGVLTAEDVRALQEARDAGIRQLDAIARAYFHDAPGRQAIGARYLRDNISYDLGDTERAGLERFYRYAAEIGVAPDAGALRFF